MPPTQDPNPPRNPQTTRWTMLDALSGQEAEAAWAWFVDRYRPYVRGILLAVLQDPEQARAAESEFWGYVYLSNAVRRADRGRRFRTFLAGIVRNFARAWRRSHTIEEGNAVDQVDRASDADLVQAELTLWTDTVVGLALRNLRDEMPKAAEALTRFYGLQGDEGAQASTSDIAKSLQCTQQAVYQLLSRGRQRLRELIAAELMEGCSDPQEMEAELCELLRNLGQRHPGVYES
jgi:RNA polymerase sigma factor (sigma-70 family)